MPTARTILTGALRSLGVVAAEEPLTAVMATDGLELLNALVDSYSLEHLTIYYTPATVVPLLPGVGSYVWGSGSLPGDRPLQLGPRAQLRDATSLYDYPITVLDQERWGMITNKTVSGQPTAIYYAPSFPLGELFVTAVPTVPWDLIVYPWQVLSGFVNLDIDVAFPPGYERLLRTGLTVEAAPEYHLEPTGVQLAQLMEAKMNVKRRNVVVPESLLDTALWQYPSDTTYRAWRP